MLELIPVHADIPCEMKNEIKSQCILILNEEWPRSETLRLRTLNASKESFPMCLALLKRPENIVIGHVKLSEIPSICYAVWIESIVIHPDLRGKGIGKYLMFKSEEYCKSKGFKAAYLCTIDKQIFYSRCGYKFCKPVTASSGTVTQFREGMFSGGNKSSMKMLVDSRDNLDEDLLPQRTDELGSICQQVFQENPGLPDQEPIIKLPLRPLRSMSKSTVIDKNAINRITIHKDFMKKWL